MKCCVWFCCSKKFCKNWMKGHCKYCGQGPDQVICYKILHSSYEAAKLSRVTKWFVKSRFFLLSFFSFQLKERTGCHPPSSWLLNMNWESECLIFMTQVPLCRMLDNKMSVKPSKYWLWAFRLQSQSTLCLSWWRRWTPAPAPRTRTSPRPSRLAAGSHGLKQI